MKKVWFLISFMLLSSAVFVSCKEAGTQEEVTTVKEDTKQSVIGNTPGNLAAGGYLAQDGEWIYYCDDKDNYSIYRRKTDGTSTEKLNNMKSSALNVADGWIYYTYHSSDGLEWGISKMKTDGTCNQIICPDVSDDWMYYNDEIYYSAGNTIAKMDINGKNDQNICIGNVWKIFVQDDWVYYYYEYKKEIRRTKTDGSDTEVLHKGKVEDFVSDGINLYFITNKYKLVKINFDGTEKQIIDKAAPAVNMLNVTENWIYYNDAGDYFCRIKKDGTDKQKIMKKRVDIRDIHVTDNALLYFERKGAGLTEEIIGHLELFDSEENLTVAK